MQKTHRARTTANSVLSATYFIDYLQEVLCMFTQNKSMICLVILPIFFIMLAGCVFSSSTGYTQNSNTNPQDITNQISETSGTNESSQQGIDPATTDTTVRITATPSNETSTRKPTTTKPTTTKPATPSPTTTTAPAKPSGIVLDNLLDKSAAYITEQFGKPVAIEKSEYGFSWHIYHKNYANFFMIGIQNNKVVGLYSNSKDLSFASIKTGTTKRNVRAALKDYTGPMKSIYKNKFNTEYWFQETMLAQRDVFTDNQKYITVFYDNIKGGILTAVQIIDYSTEQSIGLYPTPNKGFIDSYERISFHLINATRVRFNKSRLQYDNNMAEVAAAHSQDMIDRSFFDHINPDGLRVGDRIEEAGYRNFSCAENLAKDHSGAISAHENYMNSSGHRENILGNEYKYVGVGVRMTKDAILQSQVYITDYINLN
jgi:uncharacterized protein YkwD